jgi:large subunit ribosomal protein L4
MLKAPLYAADGSKAGDVELDPSVFGVTPKEGVLHQVVVAKAANARASIAHTKMRGEVRGGGRKPWRQKGTGRARHGSIRSPLWVGGGVTFGPRNERAYGKRVNTKQRRSALRMALSAKVLDTRLVVVESFAPDGGKTKEARRVLETISESATDGRRTPSLLMVLAASERDSGPSMKNLQHVRSMDARHLNAADALAPQLLIFTRAALEVATVQFAPGAASAVVSPATAPSDV